ncbi:ankyrin repeat-containing domain protein [Immersiella caudata]|uniref:Ankyrin repeat-containing domain protein n=1 Tax=Immersiella caudata TaxID=314043 RepID=A0AA39WVZ0_9PEZI|nr:ankyrin repeat-containing domain protein [Immersiella caudata]
MARVDTSGALALVGVDLGCRTVSASFMLPRKVDRRLSGQDAAPDDSQGWGYLIRASNPASNFLLSAPSSCGEALRQGLSSQGHVEAGVPEDMERALRHFFAGFKRHIEASLHLAFGKEIPDTSYAVSCTLPAWMPDPARGDLMRAVSSTLTTNITCCPSPAASLTYFLSKTSKAKKPTVVAGDMYLHCSIDETLATFSHYGLRSEPGNTFALGPKACRVLLCGAYHIRDAFYESLEQLLLHECHESLPGNGEEVFNKISEVSEAFYKWACTKFDGVRDYKARLPWEIPDCERRGFAVRRGQLIVAAVAMLDQIFKPLLTEIFESINDTVPTSKTRTHILISGALSESPYLSQSLPTLIADGGRKGDLILLLGMNGTTAVCRGAGILIDGARKHPMAKRRWPEWTPTVAQPRNLLHRMSILEARILQLESEVATATVRSGTANHKFNLTALRKRAGVLLAEHAKRDGPTENTFRIANCCQSMEPKAKTDASIRLVERMEQLASSAQCHKPPRQRLEGLHYAALSGNEAAIQFFHAAQGCDVNAPSGSEGDYNGWRPMHLAVSGRHANALLKLLQVDARAGLLETTGTGLTCLHLAVIEACVFTETKTAQGALDMLRLVVQQMALAGASLNTEDDQGSTALDTATALGNEQVIRILEEVGARGNTRREKMRTESVRAVETGDINTLNAILIDKAAGTFLSRHVSPGNMSILHLAVQSGRPDVVSTIVSRGSIDIDHRNDAGDTALHMTIRRHDLTVADVLLSHNASLIILDGQGMAPIHQAVVGAGDDPDLATCRLLIQHHLSRGLTIDVPSLGGWTALHIAVEFGQVDLAELLLESGANIEAASLRSWGQVVTLYSLHTFSRTKPAEEKSGQWRPLHIAAIAGDESMVRLLLRKRATPSAKDAEGCTPAERAAVNGFGAVVKLLLFGVAPTKLPPEKPQQRTEVATESVRPKKRDVMKRMFRVSKIMESPVLATVQTKLQPPPVLSLSLPDCTDVFHAAVQSGSEAVVKLLLPHVAPDAKSAATGRTPLSTAVVGGNVHIVKLLLGAGADPSISNDEGATAIHLAAGHGNPRVFSALAGFAGRITYSLMDDDQRALIFSAIATGSPDTVRKLIKDDKETRQTWPYLNKEQDALWYAISIRRPQAARAMLQERWPCLIHHLSEAIATCDAEMVRLVCHTEDKVLYKTDTFGRNAFHLCAERGNGEMCRLLHVLWGSATAIPMGVATFDGERPLYVAVSKGNTEVAAAILEHRPEQRWVDLKPRASNKPTVPTLKLAFWSGNLDMVMMFVSHAKYTAYSSDQLVEAMAQDNVMHENAAPVLEAVLHHRADIASGGRLNYEYDKILLLAATCGHMPVIQLLVPLLTIGEGYRQLGEALVAAAERDQEEVVRYAWETHEGLRMTKYASMALFRAAETGSSRAARVLVTAPASEGAQAFSRHDLWHGLELAASSSSIATSRAFYDASDCSRDGGAEILHYAIRTDNDALLKVLLDLGVDPRLQSSEGWPPLHAAVLEGSETVAKALLSRHVANIDSPAGEIASSPLHQAIVVDSSKMVSFLLENGAKATEADDQGELPIHVAARLQRGQIMELLCSHSSAGLDVLKAKNKAGYTAVDLALQNPSKALDVLLRREAKLVDRVEPSTLDLKCREGNVDAVKLLLEHGASVDVMDSEEYQPLHSAVWKNQEEVVKVLITSGKCNLEAKCNGGYTPFALSLVHQFIPLTRHLQKAGAQLDTVQGFENWQVSHQAARFGRVAAINYLIEIKLDLHAKTSKGLQPLHLAAYGGHIEVAKILIGEGCPINNEDDDKKTSLSRAIDGQHVDMVKLLLEFGAQLDHNPEGAFSVLHDAAKYDSSEIVGILLDAGANVHHQAPNDETPLHMSTYYGKLDNVRLLLARGADPKRQNGLGKMPIHYAAQAGHIAVAELLLDAAPETMEATMEEGKTPLHVAAWYQQGEFVRFLAKRGADIYKTDTSTHQENALMLASAGHSESTRGVAAVVALLDLGMDINWRNAGDYTPLTYAIATSKRKDVVELCLSRGADPNAVVTLADGRKKAAVMYAIAKDQPAELVEVLRQYGANFNVDLDSVTAMGFAVEGRNLAAMPVIAKAAPDLVNAMNEMDVTPLQLAASYGFVDCIEKLVELGADVHAKSLKGYTAIHWASSGCKPDVVRVLAKHGADLESPEPDEGRVTPLYRVIVKDDVDEAKRLETARAMLECGAKVDGRTTGWEPIHIACETNRVGILDLLHEWKANLVTPTDNEWGHSPLHIAVINGRAEAARWLLEHGADVNYVNKKGSTPLSYCLFKDKPSDMWQLLLNWPGCSTVVVRDPEDSSKNLTALHLAAERGVIPAITAVANKFPDLLETRGKHGCTPLNWAAMNSDSVDAIRTLMDLGADQTSRTDFGSTPVTTAAIYAKPDVLRLFSDWAVANHTLAAPSSDAGYSCLHVAAKHNNVEMCRAVLEKAPRLRGRVHGGSGKAPEGIAREKGKGDVVEFLEGLEG